MKEQIIRIDSITDKPETKIIKSVSINFDGKQYFVRIPKKISDFLEIEDNNMMKITLDIPYMEETKKKILVVEIVGTKNKQKKDKKK